MTRKPTSGDSEQREREAERARRHSQLSASRVTISDQNEETPSQSSDEPAHGAAKGESAHGAMPRPGIDSE